MISSLILTPWFLSAMTAPVEYENYQDPSRVDWARLSRRLDEDGDGRVTREEFPGRNNLFRRLDRNRDGVLTRADFDSSKEPTPTVPEGPADPEALALFEEKVLPILEENCFNCHSSSARRVRAELRLDTLGGLLAGGTSGPALAPGDPDRSLLVEAVRYADDDYAMPPDGPLETHEIEAIERWVELGAPWPGEEVPAGENGYVASEIDLEAGRDWWSLKPVLLPDIPEASDASWGRRPLDSFILAGMEDAGVEPVGDADRVSWLRRVSFDLTGLPPTPEEIEQFVGDRAPDAREKVVDRLLSSAPYAERWARHWLDVARYAESSGRETNVVYPHAWRYRDWVIDAFEEDMPYDMFLEQQLAGDLLPASDEATRVSQAVATGYLALGPKSHNTRNPLQFTADLVDEQIDAISRGMLGMTLACARCHDHKFDPISTEDYYALAGILGSTETLFGTYRTPGNRHTSELRSIPAGVDVADGPDLPDELRTLYQRRRVELSETMSESMEEMSMDRMDMYRMRVARDAAAALDDLIGRYDEDGRVLSTERYAMGARESRPRDSRVLVRGELDSPGPRIQRRFPMVLTDSSTPVIDRGSGRIELAEWITAPENPLTARVWVNRVWSKLFGRGLVQTADNFGRSGLQPSHPELLDFLAVNFVEGGWSTRELIREIVLSRTYGLACEGDRGNEAIDPDVVTLWRMPARRLEAEAIRDSMLFAAGTLDLERPEGSPMALFEGQTRREGLVETLVSESNSRSIYLPILRDRVPEALECFDAADPSFVTGQREVTTVPSQALFMMNDEDVIAAADALARRVSQLSDSDRGRIRAAFELTLSRAPESWEVRTVKEFLDEFEELAKKDGHRRAEELAWSAIAQSLFQSAEFRDRG